MANRSLKVKTPGFNKIRILIVGLFLAPGTAGAWGFAGHSQVGRLALAAVDDQAASELRDILGPDVLNAADRACSWPDMVRETPEWEWSAPQHYVNIPRAVSTYDRQRDCPEGLCVTEAIKKYADQLTDPRLDANRRWEAFAWLCHLVGDLHQPLHTGYKDDRGGGYVEIVYQGEPADLHQFWDRVLIQERLENPSAWQTPAENARNAASEWSPSDVDDWTNESHCLVKTAAYPPASVIEKEFADQSWLLIQEQWSKGGNRLARILNATIGNGEVLITREQNTDENVQP